MKKSEKKPLLSLKNVIDSIKINGEHAMYNQSKYLVAIVFITIINGYVATHFMKQNKEVYHEHYNNLMIINADLQDQLDEFYQYGIKVDVTMYQPTRYQTDSTPNITADGTHIRINKASQYKFVALSRNLLKRWGGPFDYGDFILLKGTDGKDGVYQVRDTMNPKWVNVVDILESKHVAPYKFEDCDIFKLPWTKENA
tara:strand:- start:1016 stop:1609 length:594 start_codon:yes stop_codon:yes gene_type:complete